MGNFELIGVVIVNVMFWITALVRIQKTTSHMERLTERLHKRVGQAERKVDGLTRIANVIVRKNLPAMPKTLPVVLLDERAKAPTRGTTGSGGLDLYAIESVCIRPDSIVKLRTGLAMAIPEGFTGLLMTRSSMGARGVCMAAGANVIDSDYRNEVFVCLRNAGEYDWNIEPGDRIGQLVIVPYAPVTPVELDGLDETEREGGFGSTGR